MTRKQSNSGNLLEAKVNAVLRSKIFGSWKSIYIGSTGYMNGKLFKNIARYAGLHVYNEDSDVMFFNKSLIAIHASSSGTKKNCPAKESGCNQPLG